MAEFASRGVGAAGLTTGIIGSALGAANSGLLGNLFGSGWNNNSGARMAAEHIEKARESHEGDDRAMGMLDVWEQWLHHVAGEMAEVKAMIDSYK